MAGTPSSSRGLVSSATVTLTNAQIKALPTTGLTGGFELVPAPAAGSMILYLRGVMVFNCAAVYTNVNVDAIFDVSAGDLRQSAHVPAGDGNWLDNGVNVWVGNLTLRHSDGYPIATQPGEDVGYLRSSVSGAALKLFAQNPYGTNADGDRYLTHLDRVFVKVGDPIAPTIVIGTVCDSAVSHLPGTSHVHYGFHRFAPATLFDVIGPLGGSIARNQSAAQVAKGIASWVRRHGLVSIQAHDEFEDTAEPE